MERKKIKQDYLRKNMKFTRHVISNNKISIKWYPDPTVLEKKTYTLIDIYNERKNKV